MSTMLIQSGTLDDIADAIRAKTGKVASMTPLEMPDEIESISGGGGGLPILSGTSDPTASQGTDGQEYVKYANYTYKSFYDGAIIIRENDDDSTDIKAFISGFTKSSNDYIEITDANLLAYLSDVTAGKFKACDIYKQNDSTQYAFFFMNQNGTMYINTTNSAVSSRVTGTFYDGMIDLNQPAVSSATAYQKNGHQTIGGTASKRVNNAFLRKNDTWQDLIGSDIDDMILSVGESPIDYAIEQGQTTSTSTTTASLTEGKYYLFSTVYDGSAFSGANISIGDTNPIYTASGIGKVGCIIKATSSTVTYSRSGNVSANEYTEIDVIPNADIGGIGNVWNSGTAISSIKDDLYFLTLGDGETGDIVGADILVEHELVDTVTNGTRFLIVKATGSSITLDNSHSFYYRQIGIIGSGGGGQRITYKNYAKFDSEGIILPFACNTDYTITAEFYDTKTTTANALFNTTGSSSVSTLVFYMSNASNYAVGTGKGSGGNVTMTRSVGNHTVIMNDSNSQTVLDGTQSTSFTRNNLSSRKYTVGCQVDSITNVFQEYFKSYKLESLSTGNKVCELKPALLYEEFPCLYDSVNDKVYMPYGLTVMDTLPT